MTAAQGEVLIAGAGPTGCTLALLLARAGIPTTLIEQNARPQQHPAACILNTRTMEVFREIGIERPILDAAQSIFEHGRITWVVSLAGQELGRCSALPPDLERVLSLSPTHTVQFPQHMLEPLLWERIERQPLITFRKNTRVVSVGRHAEDVVLTTLDRSTGRESIIPGAYLAACDGASSAVRTALSMDVDGPLLQHMVGIHFRCDLGQLVNERKSILYWILNERLVGVLIAHWLPTEWVLFAPYFPPQQQATQFTDDVCRRLIEIACGGIPDDLELLHRDTWVVAARLARTFKQGRVYLCGDAAHSFPPTGGLGLNTGVQDAHNLSWKLAAVLKGRAHEWLLDTYEGERKPVARANLDHSLRNFLNMNALTKLVGVDRHHLRFLEAVQQSWAFQRLPSSLQRRLVEKAIETRLRRLSRLDADGPQGEDLRARFRALLPGQEPHYRFLGLDLGFVYAEGAVVTERTRKPQAVNPVVDYLPTTWPGARLPHVWVRRGDQRLSVHDLSDGERFLVLTHPAGHRHWNDAVMRVREEYLVPAVCLSIGPDGSAHLHDEQGVWRDLSEVDEGGAVLVRPDGHVAWRSVTAAVDPFAALAHALQRCGAKRTAASKSSCSH